MNKARAGASGVTLDHDVLATGKMVFWGIPWKTVKRWIKFSWKVLSERMKRYRSTA